MKLSKLVENLSVIEILGSLEHEIGRVDFDSRKVESDSIYIAQRGHLVDGHKFIEDCIDKGATAIVCEELPTIVNEEVTFIVVQDSAKALGEIASTFFGNPSETLTLIGITGTNGKTSVATLLYQVFTKMGHPSALISTVENKIFDKVIPSTHTTPDPVKINEILAEAVTLGCQYAFMEVSSHAVVQKRIAGLNFKVAGFTNITHDHLDYHGTFQEYIKAKKLFFDLLSTKAIAISNADDRNSKIMVQNSSARKVTYGLKNLADYSGKILEADFNGMLLKFCGKEVWTTLTGKFNASNLLLVYSIAMELGKDSEEVLKAISLLTRVKGRFETYKSPMGIFFIIDYAHTPDALANVLDSINEIRTQNERLLTVFGCGGDRDKSKRPEMGSIATKKSTLSILTSDNPRREDPVAIIKDIEEGVSPEYFSKYTVTPDRKEAIKMAIKFAEPGDIVLVAGKGHETYQEVNGVKHHFDDKETIIELVTLMDK